MAEIAVPRNEFSRLELELAPPTVDRMLFEGRRYSLEVLNHGSDPAAMLYFSVDGNDPEPQGGRTYPVWPNSSYPLEDLKMVQAGVTEVRLVSRAPLTYSVIASMLT